MDVLHTEIVRISRRFSPHTVRQCGGLSDSNVLGWTVRAYLSLQHLWVKIWTALGHIRFGWFNKIQRTRPSEMKRTVSGASKAQCWLAHIYHQNSGCKTELFQLAIRGILGSSFWSQNRGWLHFPFWSPFILKFKSPFCNFVRSHSYSVTL